jgi:hypothetical protein
VVAGDVPDLAFLSDLPGGDAQLFERGQEFKVVSQGEYYIDKNYSERSAVIRCFVTDYRQDLQALFAANIAASATTATKHVMITAAKAVKTEHVASGNKRKVQEVAAPVNDPAETPK